MLFLIKKAFKNKRVILLRQGNSNYYLRGSFAKQGISMTARPKTRHTLEDEVKRLRAQLTKTRKILQAAQKIHTNEELYQQLFESSPYGIFIKCENKIVLANAAFRKIIGAKTSQEIINKPVMDIIHPDYRELVQKRFKQITEELKLVPLIEEKFLRLDGESIDVEVITVPYLYHNKPAAQVILQDITRHKQTQTQVAYIASHNPITGIVNRLWLEEYINKLISSSSMKKKPLILAILLLDINRFKNVNDALGYKAGDQLLQLTADRLRKCIRANDLVARTGGNEFIIILSDVADATTVHLVAQKILDSFKNLFLIQGKIFHITASIGISLYPNDGGNSAALLKNANIALHHAKEQGHNNYQFSTEELTTQLTTRVSLENALNNALLNNELILYYQPKIDIKNNRIIGLEALLRWRRADGTMISPEEFIPLAENIDRIALIGEWVLRTACIQHKLWREQGFFLNISINLSARQFLEADLEQTIKRIVRETDMDPSYLELELTESVLVREAAHAINVLKNLKAFGIQIAIDDFGIGYSSLSYLKYFTIDRLKIDKSFICDIGKNANSAAIILAIIAMAHSLGFKVIAEGVETKAQLEFLMLHQCDEIQGFYISHALPANQITAFLKKYRAI